MPDEFRKFARDAIKTARGVGQERRSIMQNENALTRRHEMDLNRMNNESAERQAGLRAEGYSGGLRGGGGGGGFDSNLFGALLRSEQGQPGVFAPQPRLDQYMKDMRDAETSHRLASPHGSPADIREKQESILGDMRKRHDAAFGPGAEKPATGLGVVPGRIFESVASVLAPWGKAPSQERNERIAKNNSSAVEEQQKAAQQVASLSKASEPKYGGDIRRYLTENFGEEFANQIIAGSMPGAERSLAGDPVSRAMENYHRLTGAQPPSGGTPPGRIRQHAAGTTPEQVFPGYDGDFGGIPQGGGFIQIGDKDGGRPEDGRLWSLNAPEQPPQPPTPRGFDTRDSAGLPGENRLPNPPLRTDPQPAQPAQPTPSRGPIDGVDDLHSGLGERSVQPPAHSPSSDRRVSTDGLRNADILNALRNPKEGSPAAKLYDSIASAGRKVVGASEDVHVAAREGARDIADRIKSTDIAALASQKIGDSSFAEFISDMVRTAKSEGFSGADLHAVEKLEAAIADGKELAKPVKDSAATAIEALLKQLEEAGKTSKAYANRSLR